MDMALCTLVWMRLTCGSCSFWWDCQASLHRYPIIQTWAAWDIIIMDMALCTLVWMRLTCGSCSFWWDCQASLHRYPIIQTWAAWDIIIMDMARCTLVWMGPTCGSCSLCQGKLSLDTHPADRHDVIHSWDFTSNFLGVLTWCNWFLRCRITFYIRFVSSGGRRMQLFSFIGKETCLAFPVVVAGRVNMSLIRRMHFCLYHSTVLSNEGR